MMKSNDEMALKRLVLVKRLYLEGIVKATHQHSYSDLLLAIIELFLSVETAMITVVLGVDRQPQEVIGHGGYAGGPPSTEKVSHFTLGEYHKFDQLFNQVVAVLRSRGDLAADEPLFQWTPLARLQKARNDAQHGAKAPHPSDLAEFSTTTLQFIERILVLRFPHFGTSLTRISMAGSIADEVLRQYMEHAEVALDQGNPKGCTLLARIAFLLGRLKRRYNWWKNRDGCGILDDYDVSHALDEAWSASGLGLSEGNQPLSKLLWNLMTETRKLPGLFDDWVLGLDRADRERLIELTPRLARYGENTRGLPPSDETVVLSALDDLLSAKSGWGGPHFGSVPTRDDCFWVCDFVTESLIRWEQEQQAGFVPIDEKYKDALPILMKTCE